MPGTAGNGGGGSVGIAGNSGGGTGGSGGTTVRPPTWTVLVYANGDNNIMPNLWTDMIEMVRAKLTPDIGLYVYADYPAGEPVPGTTNVFPSGSELMHIIGNGDVETLLTKAEEDLDNPNTLSAAITSVFTAHPADSYGLLRDYGGGWRYGFGGDEQNGTRTGRSIAVEAVATAVRAGIAGANLRGAPPLEFFSYDTCPLLGSPEVAAPLAGRRACLHRQRGARLRRRAGTTRPPSPGWPPTRPPAWPISPARRCQSGAPTTAAWTKTCCSSRTWRSTCLGAIRRTDEGTVHNNVLLYAHRKRDDDDKEIGLVHRDMSPQNILISYEGEVKVIDFGLAKSTLNVAQDQPQHHPRQVPLHVARAGAAREGRPPQRPLRGGPLPLRADRREEPVRRRAAGRADGRGGATRTFRTLSRSSRCARRHCRADGHEGARARPGAALPDGRRVPRQAAGGLLGHRLLGRPRELQPLHARHLRRRVPGRAAHAEHGEGTGQGARRLRAARSGRSRRRDAAERAVTVRHPPHAAADARGADTRGADGRPNARRQPAGAAAALVSAHAQGGGERQQQGARSPREGDDAVDSS